ncbi:MAG: hypothetical protein F9K27_16690 [Anaerolineae bacterium]|nr:MAG: hypothetical protein F9K27_16690 [Anaerolineae bacterium]
MRLCESPSLVGLLVVGILFNIVLGILGLLGFTLLDALWVTASLLTIIGAAVVQHFIQQERDKK